MDHQFVFTPEDVYRSILAIAGFIVSVTAAVKIINDTIKKAKEPDKIQNDRITSLEGRMLTVERGLKSFERNQRKAEEAWVLYMEAMFAMMNHIIDGNHVENLKQTRDKMQMFIAKHSMSSEPQEEEKKGWD